MLQQPIQTRSVLGLMVIITDTVQEWCQSRYGPDVRLEPKNHLGNRFALPGRSEPTISLLDEVLVVEPLGESVARFPRNVEALFEFSPIERFLEECFERWAVSG